MSIVPSDPGISFGSTIATSCIKFCKYLNDYFCFFPAKRILQAYERGNVVGVILFFKSKGVFIMPNTM